MRRETDHPIFTKKRINQRADVFVGNGRGGPRITPTLRATRFGGRVRATLEAIGVQADVAEERTKPSIHGSLLEAEMIRTDKERSRSELHRWYDKGDEGFEWEIEWDSFASVPISGKVEYSARFPTSLSWHRQELTQQDIDEGCSCPENVQGSYAIYHNKSGNICDMNGDSIVNYETGKWGHVYRPELIAANGERAWCHLWYDPERLVMGVTLPMEWMREAVYPVILDPTFGYTSAGSINLGASTGSQCQNGSLGTYVATSGDTVTGVSVYNNGTTGTASFSLSVYEIPTVSSTPTNRLFSPLTNSSVTAKTWGSVTVSSGGGMSGSTRYGAATYGNSNFAYAYDALTSYAKVRARFDTLDDPWPTNSNSQASNSAMSLYATYSLAPTGRVPFEYFYDD